MYVDTLKECASITVPTRSKRLSDAMRSLFAQAYRPWPTVLEERAETNFRLSPESVGFECVPAYAPEREYHYAIMRWAAFQVGRRRRRFRSPSLLFDDPVPYLLLDGAEAHPVPLDLCDRLGMLVDATSIARELAWHYIPEGTFERVAITHCGRPPEEIEGALVEAGFDGGRRVLRVIQSQLFRLDAIWQRRF